MKSFLVAVSLIVAIAILYTVPLVFLWNTCVVGTIDGVHELTFWKALGLAILISMLSTRPIIKEK